MNKKADKALGIISIIAFGLLLGYMLFHNLGKGYLIQTDEAYHATNAYEMLKEGNWLVNIYRYTTDYFNSKPPLCLDLMILSYKLFGVSGFAARFPSALGGMLTFIIIVSFLLYKKDIYSAAVFPALFCSCTGLFTYHMYRAAEMDSIYNLFFVIAMLSLQLIKENYAFMYVYGIALGLAFMCKGPHAALILIIGVLYIPAIRDAFRSVKRVLVSALLAAIIPVCWIVMRYQFDGLELLNALFMGEVVGRVSGDEKKISNMPIFDFLSSGTVIIFIAVVAVALVMILIHRSTKKISLETVKAFFADNYLYLLWTIIPIIFFSITSYLTWYTYTSRIAMCILTANFISWIIREVSQDSAIDKIVIGVLVAAISLWLIVPCIVNDINPAGTGGHSVDNFTEDMREFHKEYGDTYSGVNTYLIAEWKINKDEDGHWEPEYVAPAEMYCDLLPVDGTIDDFLNDPDSILILDKTLWDEYAPILTGHVILLDNSYLIFTNDMY